MTELAVRQCQNWRSLKHEGNVKIPPHHRRRRFISLAIVRDLIYNTYCRVVNLDQITYAGDLDMLADYPLRLGFEKTVSDPIFSSNDCRAGYDEIVVERFNLFRYLEVLQPQASGVKTVSRSL